MKNKIYYLGLASCIIITLGCLFKIMHWPGAGIALMLGILLISLLFLPLALYDNFAKGTDKNSKWLYILTALVMAFNFISALFKILHWPYAGLLLTVALPLPFVILLPVYFFVNRNDKEINYKNYMAVFFFFAYFAAISALLVLGPTKELINGFKTSSYLYSQNAKSYSPTTPKVNSEKSKETTKIMTKTVEVLYYIEIAKSHALVNALNYRSTKTVARLNLSQVKNLETYVFIDQDVLFKLRNALVDYKDCVKKVVDSNGALYQNIDAIIDTNDELSWDKKIVNGQIIVSAISNLNFIEHQVKFVEDAALAEIN